MTKKIAVLKRGYEYNDNWYSHDSNIEIQNSKIFNNIEDAETFRKEATFIEINEYPTNGNLRNVINDSGVDVNLLLEIIKKYSDNSIDDYEIFISPKLLFIKRFKDDIYNIIKDLYYTLVDIEVDDNSSTLSLDWENNYEAKTRYIFINDEDNNILLHSATEAAKVEKDEYEEYVEYYLKGKKYDKKSDWLSESRKYKIDNILKSEE